MTSLAGDALVTVCDDSGGPVGTKTIRLDAWGRQSFMLTDYFAVTGRGTVEFQTPAGGQIAPLAFRASTAGIPSTIPATVK